MLNVTAGWGGYGSPTILRRSEERDEADVVDALAGGRSDVAVTAEASLEGTGPLPPSVSEKEVGQDC